MFSKKTQLEKSLQAGEKIVEKQLDVRSLIMTQNLLLTTIKLLVKPKAKRELMRIQRWHKVLRTNNSSDDDDDDFAAIAKKSEAKILNNAIVEIESVGYDLSASTSLMDEGIRELLAGVIGRKGGGQVYGSNQERAQGSF